MGTIAELYEGLSGRNLPQGLPHNVQKRLRCAAASSVKLGWSCDNMKDTPPRELSSVWGGVCGSDTGDGSPDVISARARAHIHTHR